MFNRGARSPVGAMGLMQLMPPTARLVASKLKLPKPQEGDLLRPEINIPLGSYYLKMLNDQFKGWECLATPSYNAGPGRTFSWMSSQEVPIDLWLEDIPFDETRLYVQRVMSYQVLYQYRLGKKVTRLRDQMPRLVSRALLRQDQAQGPANVSPTLSQELESLPEPKPKQETQTESRQNAFIDL
jgi:soluble lytic murein transglycosylase